MFWDPSQLYFEWKTYDTVNWGYFGHRGYSGQQWPRKFTFFNPRGLCDFDENNLLLSYVDFTDDFTSANDQVSEV